MKLLLPIFASLLFAPALQAQSPANGIAKNSDAVSVRVLEDQVWAHFRQLKTLSANFSQTDDRGRISKGKMLLMRPGYIRFDYRPQIPFLIVSNKKNMMLIDYKLRQVQRYPIKKTPLAVLLERQDNLSKQITIVAQEIGEGNAIAATVTSVDKPEYGSLLLIFQRGGKGPAGLKLSGWQAKDGQGGLTTVTLSGLDYKARLKKRDFRYKDPRPLRRPGAMR